MEYVLKKKSERKGEQSRLGELKTRRGLIDTPVFMPVGTVGSVKGMSPKELVELNAQIILGNTYHLYLRPGTELVKNFGGLHEFIGWDRPILTDSGGYQVFSLGANYEEYGQRKMGNGIGRLGETHDPHATEPSAKLVKITEEGARFKSHIDGSEHLFTPEKVIDIQLELGSDILMPLDHCPSALADEKEIDRAVEQTNRWFQRTWEHFEKKTKGMAKRPALFAIVQGGPHRELREKSYRFLSRFPVDGFSVGGVANAGESKLKQKKALEYTLPLIPEDKPRYLMGVGEPEDIIAAVKEGIDMFDCVLPTRLARHGVVWVTENWLDFGKLDLRKSMVKEDKGPIMEKCECYACQNFSRAYIHHLIKEREILGIRLTTIHNLHVILSLMKRIRQNI